MICSAIGHWSRALPGHHATGMVGGGRLGHLSVAVALLSLVGCGGPRLYPVHGKVTWENGTEARELVGGLVICESENGQVGARGDIEQDGSFRLTTYKPGDGLLPGKYRVAVVEYSPKEPPPPPI